MTQNPTHESGHDTRPADPAGPQTTDERLEVLEAQVQTLAQAVRALSRGLEGVPTEDVDVHEQAARGARLAHELLLAQGLGGT